MFKNKKALNRKTQDIADDPDLNFGSGGGIRTPGLVVNSHPLYR
jgi:hypothetical protein